MNTLIYDGTFEGYLTCFALSENFSDREITFLKSKSSQIPLFSEPHIVKSNREKALIIWNLLEHKSPKIAKTIYFAFLSDEIGIESILTKFILYFISPDISNPELVSDYRKYLETLQIKVAQEKARMEQNIQFIQLQSGVFYAEIHPVFNSTPLITKELKHRFKGATWVIHDTKRNYGIQCVKNKLEYIQGLNRQLSDVILDRDLTKELNMHPPLNTHTSNTFLKQTEPALMPLSRRKPNLRMQKAG